MPSTRRMNDTVNVTLHRDGLNQSVVEVRVITVAQTIPARPSAGTVHILELRERADGVTDGRVELSQEHRINSRKLLARTEELRLVAIAPIRPPQRVGILRDE